jgi:hypothetical protein
VTSFDVWWPVIAMISNSLQPSSANRAAAAFRSLWTEQ